MSVIRYLAILSIWFSTLISTVCAADSKPAKSTAPKAVSATPKSDPAATNPTADSTSSDDSNQVAEPVWLDDYSEAMRQAKTEKKLMLIHFFRPSDQQRKAAADADDSVVNVEKRLATKANREKLAANYVLVKLPIDATVTVKGDKVRLLDHKAFAELHKAAGIAVIDLAHEKTEYWGYVVSAIPFTPGKYYRFRAAHLDTLLDLPEGTLTQRTMVFAVRIHPEHPASTNGQEDPILLSEATGHSNYQADVKVQGHQGWGSRFERIIGKLLGRGTPGLPVEVVAESWPNEDLMDSCVDCVASWRQSEGHWDAVRAQQASYGYDIREGDNGIWYATGIFRPKQ
jgi:hypothetical protein